MKRIIELHGRTIEYDLERKNVKNLNLRIKADQSVFVSANYSVPEKTIDDFLRAKAKLIINTIDRYAEMEKYAPKPKSYIDGESFKILGRDLRLRVVEGKKNYVISDEAYITLFVKHQSSYYTKKKTMDRWTKAQCMEHVKSICEYVYPKFKKYGVDYPQLRFRKMVSCWGSCQPKRKILTFNTALVEAPVSCIEYVVTHEFVHFLHPNHSQEFYQCLNMFMPDWKARKSMLEKSYHYFE